MLSIYAFVKTSESPYWLISWPGWMIAFSWAFAPFWFNPNAFTVYTIMMIAIISLFYFVCSGRSPSVTLDSLFNG